MAYLEFEIPARSLTASEKEILLAKLSLIGFDGFVEGDEILQAYIEEDMHSVPALNQLIDELSDLGIKVQYRFHKTENQNWNEEWEKKFEPVVVENKVLIRAPFHDATKDLTCTIIIEPKMSFGTGHHHTTQLMINEMMKHDFKGQKVLDMGCGTGVLGILACKLGADRVLGIDHDQWAYENALENVERNGANAMEVCLGDVSKLQENVFDIVLANITRNTLVRDMMYYVDHLVAQGIMILSGFLAEDVQYVLNAAYRVGANHMNTLEDSNWIALSFVKP